MFRRHAAGGGSLTDERSAAGSRLRTRLADRRGSSATRCWPGWPRSRSACPAKFFYDARGSALFEEICELPGVLPDPHRDRDPRRIRRRDRRRRSGRTARLIEFGSGAEPQVAPPARGAAERRRPMCRSTSRASICDDAAAQLRRDYPEADGRRRCAPTSRGRSGCRRCPARRASGSGSSRARRSATSSPRRRRASCATARELLGPRRRAGDRRRSQEGPADPATPPTTTAPASRRPSTSTCCARINRELGGDFDLSAASRTWPSTTRPRAGSRSTSAASPTRRATVAGRRFDFAAGERIHTEYSYKYDDRRFRGLAAPRRLPPRRDLDRQARPVQRALPAPGVTRPYRRRA